MKSKRIKIRNLEESKLLKKVGTKPYFFFVLYLLISIPFCFGQTIILGIALVTLFAGLLLFSKDRILVSFFDKYFVVYESNDLFCYVVYYDEIKDFKIKQQTKYNELIINFINDETVTFEVLTTTRIRRMLKKVFEGKI